MQPKTRKIAGIKVNVVTETIKLAELSHDTRYQYRLDDNPWVRGKDIAKSIKDCDAKEFRDRIIVVEIDGVAYVVDGFGRLAAAEILGWTELEVDFIHGGKRYRERMAHRIALAANLGQVSQKGNNKKELQTIAFRLHNELKLSYEEIAAMQNTTVETVKKRVMRGQAIVAQMDASANPAAIRPFPNKNAAKTMAVEALKIALKLHASNYEDACQILADRYGVTLCLLVGDNEKQVYRLCYDALNRARREEHSNYLVFFYIATVGHDTGAGQRMLANVRDLVEHYAPGTSTFHGEDLSKDTAACNYRAVAQYAQSCRSLQAA